MPKKLLHRFRKNNKGVALVELALVMPILLILVMGIVEFGWIFNGYITLTGAAREGARVYVTGGDYEAAVTEHVQSLLPALQVNSPSIDEGDFRDDQLKVTLTGSISLLSGGLFLPFLEDPFPLTAEASMRQE